VANGLVDRRTVTFGTSVPLKAQVDLPTLDEIEAGGARSLSARAKPGEASVEGGPRRAPWSQLPADRLDRAAADAEQRRRDVRPRMIRPDLGGRCR
jgi:hypothetical protein